MLVGVVVVARAVRVVQEAIAVTVVLAAQRGIALRLLPVEVGVAMWLLVVEVTVST